MKTNFFKLILLCSFFLIIFQKANAATTLTVATVTTSGGSNGLAASTLNTDQNGIAIMGFSAKSNSSSTVTGFTFSIPAAISGSFSNFKLYRSTSSTYSGTATQVTSTLSTTSTTVSFSFTSQTVTTTAVYFYLIADYDTPTSATSSGAFKVTAATTSSTTSGFSQSGPTYSLSPAVTLGTATTTGLASGTLSTDQNGIGILGFSIKTTQSTTITTLNLSSTQGVGNISTYFSNAKLYTNTTNSFTTATQVTGATISTLNSTSLTISGLSQAINTTTRYYFIVVDYTAPASTANVSTFMLSLNSAANSTTTYDYGSDIDGTNYTVSSPVTLGTATTSGLASGTLSISQTGIGILGFSVKTSQNTTFTTFNLSSTQSTGNIGTYFSNIKLYTNTTNSFTTATQVTGITVSSLSSTSLTISGLSQAVNNTTKYYFIVADFTAPTSSATFMLSLNSAASSTTTYDYGSDINGANYTFTSPVVLGTATTSGLAANPLDHALTGAGILGFSVKTTASLTFTTFNLTSNQPVGNIGTYFSNVKLYTNTTNSFSSATQVTGITVSSLSSTSLTISGLSQAVNSTTKYYFIVADYAVASSASSTFQLIFNSASTASATYTSGAPINGTNYTVSASTLNWLGNNSSNWNQANNWYENRVPTQYDIVQFAVDQQVSTSTSVATISTSGTTTVAGIVFAGYFSSGNVNYPGISVGSGATLNVTGDITFNVDGNPGTYNYSGANGTFPTNQYYIKGAGTMQANNMYIYANYGAISASTTQQAVISSVNRLILTGNLNLISENYKVSSNTYKQYASLFITGGTTEIDGQVNTTNIVAGGTTTYPISTLQIAPASSSGATLEFDGATPLAGLSSLGTNIVSLNSNYALVNYAGASQTVYTNNSITGLSSGVSYYDLTLSGGTITPASGTLTISDDLTTSATSADFSVNNPTVTVGDDWANSGSVTLGTSNVTVTDALTNNSNTINCGSGTLTVGGQFTNNDTFVCGSGSVIYKGGYLNTSTFTAGSGTVFFTPSVSETLKDNSTSGTVFKKVTFNNGTSTISSGTGNFAVASTGYLLLTNSASLVAGTTTSGGAAYLTLMSDANSTATVGPLAGLSALSGNVNVQRYITGGSSYRGYRLLSAPVNVSTSLLGGGNFSLAYLNTNASFGGTTYKGAFTAGPGTGFQSTTPNPTMFLYDESANLNNTTYVSGKNVGIYAITGNTVTITAGKPATQTTLRNIPVGNGYLFYFIGDNSLTTTSPTRIPENTTLTATGYLNQGSVLVNFWSKTNSSTNTFIPYHTGTGATTPGMNQVGNPYPSTIDLKQVYADNNTSISPVFWMMDEPSGTYISYKASDSTYSNARASRFIASGQGFIITASSSSKVFTFKESQKVTYPSMTKNTTTTTTPHGGTLLLSVRTNAKTDSAMQLQATPGALFGGLHLQIERDSLTYTQTGIYFGSDRSDKYDKQEDALDLDGSNPKVYISSYSSDGQRLSINELGDYAKGKRIKLFAKATTSGVYHLSLHDIYNVDTIMYNIYLVDKLHNDSLDIVRYKSYAFDLNVTDTATFGANRFVLAVERKPLPPYQLITFGGRKVTGGVQLSWKTYNEGNFTGFVLQKQGADKQFTAIQSLQSSGATNYGYVDHSPAMGNNTYRLQQSDFDGNITYSAPVTVNYNNSPTIQSLFTIYPNPTTDRITVNLSSISKKSPSYTSNIYNTAGEIVGHRVISGDSWTENVSTLHTGTYIIELKGSDGAVIGQSKFVKAN